MDHTEIAATQRDPRVNVDVVKAVSVVVEMGDTLVLPVRPLGDDGGAGLAFGAVEHRLHRGMGGLGAELGAQGVQPAFADPGRPDHRRHVAPEVPRVADVEQAPSRCCTTETVIGSTIQPPRKICLTASLPSSSSERPSSTSRPLSRM